MPNYTVYYRRNAADAKAQATVFDPAKKPEDAQTLAFEAADDAAAEAHVRAALVPDVGVADVEPDARPITGLANVKKSRPSLKPERPIPVLLDLNTVGNDRLRTNIAEALSLVEGLSVEGGVYRLADRADVNFPQPKPRAKKPAAPKVKAERPAGPRLNIGIPSELTTEPDADGDVLTGHDPIPDATPAPTADVVPEAGAA